MPEKKPKFENEPIAALVKDGVILHVDYEPVKGCQMGHLTYGEICVKCNVCGRFEGMPIPDIEDVREQMDGGGMEFSEDEGWGYDEDVMQMHYYQRNRLVAVCGWVGRPVKLYAADDYTLDRFQRHFCWSCLQTGGAE